MSSISPNSDSSIDKSVSALGNAPAITYEQLMSQDLEWAMTQGSLFFEGRGKVQESLVRITHKLDELSIPYAVVGGMALFAHGFRRYTEDVDILVTRESLHRIHQELSGRGYVPPFEKSKNLRDTETQVKIEFLISGGFPGDGKKKPIAFPDPEGVVEILQGIRYVNLHTLVELKLASGISDPHRGKDLTDIEEMIRILHLPESLAAELNPYVRDKYRELWQKLRLSTKRYVMRCRCDITSDAAQSLDAIDRLLQATIPRFQEMKTDGVEFDYERGIHDGFCYLYTHDRTVAEKYGMVHADELLDDLDQISDDESDDVS
jgi:hypothetical protein